MCLPGVLPASPRYSRVSLLAIIAKQLEIPPVLKRPRTIACQEEENWNSNIWHKVDWQQDNELRDLAE
jgi:hypothetical protein